MICDFSLFVGLSGNAAIIKPSEISLNSSKVMEEHLPQYIDKVSLLNAINTCLLLGIVND